MNRITISDNELESLRHRVQEAEEKEQLAEEIGASQAVLNRYYLRTDNAREDYLAAREIYNLESIRLIQDRDNLMANLKNEGKIQNKKKVLTRKEATNALFSRSDALIDPKLTKEVEKYLPESKDETESFNLNPNGSGLRKKMTKNEKFAFIERMRLGKLNAKRR